MTFKPFFPNPVFGWTFCGVLMVLLVVAAYIDLRRKIIPKWVSLPTLALGVLFNLARGLWMGTLNLEVWNLGAQGIWIGAADGFLFSLAGFFAGFGLFFLLWILGACQGGDLKLFAAVSAWVGPYYALWILALSTIFLIVLVALQIGASFLYQSPNAAPPSPADKKGKAPTPRSARPPRGVTYAFPLALATALTLLWFFRVDLNLAHPANFPAQVAQMEPSAWYN